MNAAVANVQAVESLHPYYQPIVREVIARAWERRLYVYVSQSRRSAEMQACIYARGRVGVGKTARFGGFVVHTFLSKNRQTVIVRCGKAEIAYKVSDWPGIATKVLYSWHVLGFAVDLSFRSGPDVCDDLIAQLEADCKVDDIAALYAALYAVWMEVSPDVRWGNDWDQDGIPIAQDPTEKGSLVDMPHWEWHPGRTIEQVRAGVLPAYPQQCSRCRNFRASLIVANGIDLCMECHADDVRVVRRRPADVACVNGGDR